jgi:hypothetical protein
MNGTQLEITVQNGQAVFAEYAWCYVNESTGGGLHYDCTNDSPDWRYVCPRNNNIISIWHDVVDATRSGNQLEGTIDRSVTDYGPLQCPVMSSCTDSGSFVLSLEPSR